MATYTPLSGHTAPETAYVVEDYPYGFRLRTTIRYWVETKRKHGQRMVSQTLNPKTNRWNKTKAGTYSSITMLALDDDNGHVVNQGLSIYSNAEEIELFALWAVNHLTEWQQGALDLRRAVQRAQKHVTVTIHTCQPGCTEHHQTMEEGQKIMRQAVAYEMRKGE